ncbi:MAG TPA: tRNA (N(6)-L-threonylcarbamoyladenosine(37)-C(2))-methylthiotransferase MtaB [bacterium]|nr:tRNA (N(6)-L-threonylcarbamoyladenosine(37)-C(2))-methylthiotransferase MtaB [bacterium]
MTTVAFFTLGCKLNQFESAAMAAQLEKAGLEIIDFSRPSDVYIINTCTVTAKTDRRSRAAIRRAQRLNPDALIVVAGCYSQVAPQEIASIPGVDVAIGNKEKTRIVSLLRRLLRDRAVEAPVWQPVESAPTDQYPMIERFFNYSRAFVKIQEGCDSQCAYCIIPTARGPNRSMSPDWVIDQIQTLVDRGYQEVVLCGTHLGTYGVDLVAGPTLVTLLSRILESTNVRRIRLSSIEPMEFDEQLKEAIVSSNRICRHLHIPLQSGSDVVLRAMNRRYLTADYRELVNWFKTRCPQMCIGADLVVGFPAEDEASFRETMQFIQDIDLSYLHVFSYSVRPGTPAAKRYSQSQLILSEEVKRRSRLLRRLSRTKRLNFAQTLVGNTLNVLVLKKTDDRSGKRVALSDNYLNVSVDADDASTGQILPARILSVTESAIVGRLLNR